MREFLDSNGQILGVGDKVAVNTLVGEDGTVQRGAGSRRVRFGTVSRIHEKTAEINFRGAGMVRAKPRSILKVDSFNERPRGRNVLITVGTNIVKAQLVTTLSRTYNVTYNNLQFQVRKHMAIKVQ